MPDNTHLPKYLSRHQYGTLLYIDQEHPTLTVLRIAHANTLGSLAYRGYLARNGVDDEKATVSLTKLGEEALNSYIKATLNQRSHERDLTERCRRLLQHSRKQKMEKSA